MQLSRHCRVQQAGIAPGKQPRQRNIRVLATASVVDSEKKTWQDEFSSLDDRKVGVLLLWPNSTHIAASAA
jgi:hypothetical protein